MNQEKQRLEEIMLSSEKNTTARFFIFSVIPCNCQTENPPSGNTTAM